MTSHPRLRVRGTPGYQAAQGELIRALIYAPDETRREWIEKELRGKDVLVQVSRTIQELVAALIEDPPPRPQLLVADFDAISAAELLHMHAIRDQGWFGSVFALGKVSLAVRQSLNIDRVFAAPLPRDALRAAMASVSHATQTVRLPRISG